MIEAAVRAFTIQDPTGPHPDKQFAPQTDDSEELTERLALSP